MASKPPSIYEDDAADPGPAVPLGFMVIVVLVVILVIGFLMLGAFAAVPATPPATKPATQPTTRPVLRTVLDRGGDYLQQLNAACQWASKQPGPVKLILPPGTHILSSTWVVASHNMEISGDGAILQMSATAPHQWDWLSTVVEFQNAQNVVFHVSKIDGNFTGRGSHFTGEPMNVQVGAGCSRVELYGFHSIGAGCDDIYIGPGTQVTAQAQVPDSINVHDCILEAAQRNSVSITAATNCQVHDLICKNAGPNAPQAAVDVEPNGGDLVGSSHGITLSGIVAQNCPGGIRTAGNFTWPTGIAFTNCSLSDCHDGIAVFEVIGVTIDNNSLGTGCSGIGINGSDACVLSNNSMLGSIYADTYQIQNPKGHTITGNVAPAGIDVHYCYGHATLSNNVGAVTQ